MTYTPEKPPNAASPDELRARIPGWGADLNPADRPSVPMLKFQPDVTGAHWEFPERQPEKRPRERSVEHKFLTPVFGTACPPHGMSGAIRRYAYRFSEGRAVHWLLLMAGDRVDSVESSFRSFLTLHPDNPITETGVIAEFKHHGLASRAGAKRTDLKHQVLDPVIIGLPWAVRYAAIYGVVHVVVRLGRVARVGKVGRVAGGAGHNAGRAAATAWRSAAAAVKR